MKQKMKIVKVTRETPDTNTLSFQGAEKMDFKPGQFLMIEFLRKEKIPKRAYSISSSPTRNENVEITVKEMPGGWVSKLLNECNKEEEFLIDGPYGHFIFDEKEMKEIVMIGAGSGVAPYRGFCHYIIDKKIPIKATFVYSSKTEEDVIFLNQLRKFEKQIPNLDLILTLTREEKKGFHNGRIDDVMIKEIISKYNDPYFFLCGPPKMVQSVKELILANGIDKDKVKQEIYG
ncbi:MAG: FAD-binding oxidoreductase [archaeon]|nr:FAD-binding oxidoreductase [archaeon]